MSTTFRPIGFWIRTLDSLIDSSFERALSERGLSRRHWQIMNLVAEGTDSWPDVARALEPFAPSVADLKGDLEVLISSGDLEIEGERLVFSTAGEVTCAWLREAIAGVRRQSAAGIERQDFDVAVSVLERMAVNLGWQDDQADAPV